MPFSNQRSLGVSRAKRSLVSVLMIVMLATQTPATPRPVGELVSELRDDLKFWLNSSRWSGTIRSLGRQIVAPQQETQAERDARAARIQIFPR